MRTWGVAFLLWSAGAGVASADSPRSLLPAISMQASDGSAFTVPSADVLVISVWSSGCAPCTGQLRNLDALADAYAGDASVTFFAVDVDRFVGTPTATHDKALKALKWRHPLVEDLRAQFIRTIEAWGAQGPSRTPKLPTTVTMPAVYVVDPAGHTHVDQKYFRDTKPDEFVEKYRPLVDQAKKSGLATAAGGAAVATTIEQESHDVAVSRGKVRLKYPMMTEAQITRTLPDVRKQLAQMFPKASDAQLDKMLVRVQDAMRKGEPVEFDSQ